jgi:hypothetical protein
MNDSIDQNVYEDLHARVNDGDDGKYGIRHPHEQLDSSRNQIVLAWDQAQPLLIHTDLKTCQQCGSKMRNKGGKKECKAKRCDACGWSVKEDGYPALIKLDHAYPFGDVEGDIDPDTGEAVPGYTTSIRLMNELAHKHRAESPDDTVRISDPENAYRLIDDGEDDIENFDAKDRMMIKISMLISLIGLALFVYRMVKFNQEGKGVSAVQIIFELCLVCYLPIIYIPVVLFMLFKAEDEAKTFDFAGSERTIRYRG